MPELLLHRIDDHFRQSHPSNESVLLKFILESGCHALTADKSIDLVVEIEKVVIPE
jgi:hypothetical protein